MMRCMAFSPWRDPHPCWHCHHYVAMLICGAAACSLRLGPRVRSQPERGCASFEREPGADDEPGPPPCAERRQQLYPVVPQRPAVDWAP